MSEYLSNRVDKNQIMYNWNMAYVNYCDGGSHASNADVSYAGKILYFRGVHNRNGVIDTLMRTKGMKTASEIVISGCSAGGLGVLLGLDDMAARIRTWNSSTTVKGLVDSGFFLDYTHGGTDYDSERKYQEALTSDNRLDYSAAMKNVYKFMGISAGAHPGCVKAALAEGKSDDRCIFGKYLAPHIETPMFILQVLCLCIIVIVIKLMKFSIVHIASI